MKIQEKKIKLLKKLSLILRIAVTAILSIIYIILMYFLSMFSFGSAFFPFDGIKPVEDTLYLLMFAVPLTIIGFIIDKLGIICLGKYHFILPLGIPCFLFLWELFLLYC